MPMSNKQHFVSKPMQSTTPQAHVAMRELTIQEMLEVVGGPEIKNGGGGLGIVAPPPAPPAGS